MRSRLIAIITNTGNITFGEIIENQNGVRFYPSSSIVNDPLHDAIITSKINNLITSMTPHQALCNDWIKNISSGRYHVTLHAT